QSILFARRWMPGSSPGMTNFSTSLLFTTGHWSLQLLHLSHLEFHPRRAAEDGDRDLEPRTLVIDFLDHAVEGGERPLAHPHLLAHLEGERRPHNFSTRPISRPTRVGRPKLEPAALGRERPSSPSSPRPLEEASGAPRPRPARPARRRPTASAVRCPPAPDA